MQDDNPANADTPPAEPAAERVPLQLALVYGEAVTELPQDLYIRRTRWRSSSRPSRARSTCCCT